MFWCFLFSELQPKGELLSANYVCRSPCVSADQQIWVPRRVHHGLYYVERGVRPVDIFAKRDGADVDVRRHGRHRLWLHLPAGGGGRRLLLRDQALARHRHRRLRLRRRHLRLCAPCWLPAEEVRRLAGRQPHPCRPHPQLRRESKFAISQ